jgi:hypothetical protein
MRKTIFIITVLVCLVTTEGFGATYYIDSVSGSDSNNGTSALTPWQTLDKVVTALPYASAVYFKSGGTWTFSSNNPTMVVTGAMLFGSYGTGAKPILNGHTGSNMIAINSQSGATIQDLELDSVSGNAVNITTSYDVAYNLTIQRCKITTSGSGTVYPIYIAPNRSASLPSIQNVTISNNEITSSVNSAIRTYTDVDSITTLTISNNNIHDVNGSGVDIFTPNGYVSRTISLDAVNIANNSFTNISRSAILSKTGIKSVSAQSYIQGNICNNLGSASQPNVNGMQLGFMQNVIIQHNYINGVQTSVPDGDGIELDVGYDSTNKSTGCIVRCNEVTGCNASPNRTAGINIIAITNSQIYGNKVYGNQIGFSLDTSYPTGNMMYNNVSYGNVYGVSETDATLGIGYPPASIWENDIIVNNSYGYVVTNSARGSVIPTENHNLWYNNIFYNFVTSNSGTYAAVPLDPTDIVSDPKFVNASAHDFHLLPSSPAIDAGTSVGLISDCDGNTIPQSANPSIGAYEYIVNATTIPVPSGQQSFVIEPPVVTPIINAVPSQADPIGVGPIAVGGSMVSILIGLDQFSASVDIYLAIVAPAIDPVNIYILTPTGFQAIAEAGLVPWMSNTVGNISVPLFENLPISQLPSGTYTLYLAVVPTGNIRAYYIWQTSFSA